MQQSRGTIYRAPTVAMFHTTDMKKDSNKVCMLSLLRNSSRFFLARKYWTSECLPQSDGGEDCCTILCSSWWVREASLQTLLRTVSCQSTSGRIGNNVGIMFHSGVIACLLHFPSSKTSSSRKGPLWIPCAIRNLPHGARNEAQPALAKSAASCLR